MPGSLSEATLYLELADVYRRCGTRFIGHLEHCLLSLRDRVHFMANSGICRECESGKELMPRRGSGLQVAIGWTVWICHEPHLGEEAILMGKVSDPGML